MNQLYIDGTWRPAADGGTREIRCPADGQLVATVAEGTRGRHRGRDRAPPARRSTTGPGRARRAQSAAQLLLRLADLIERDRKDFAHAEALDTGKRLVEAEYDIDDVDRVIRYYAGIAGTEAGRVVDTGNAGRDQPHRVRAGRRLRARSRRGTTRCCRRLEGRPGAARGQHVRAQAQRADAVDRHPADAGAGRGRAAAGRGQPGPRCRARWPARR